MTTPSIRLQSEPNAKHALYAIRLPFESCDVIEIRALCAAGLRARVTLMGSEQESVSPPGFIGFLGFWADGLTRFLDPGSESSPMFTDLSARSYIDCPPPIEIARFRLCRRPPWSGTSGSASSGGNSAPNSARQLNPMV